MTDERMHRPSVSVVTPVLNAEHMIGETIRSVVRQTAFESGRAVLDYVVADGGSTDGTVRAAEQASAGKARVVSRPDSGMYDALARVWKAGNRGATVMAYLNAGDLWHPTALDVVLDVMEQTGAQWICGYRLLYNRQGQITYVALPFRYRRRLIRSGVYGAVLPHIQQESTFWAGSLLGTVDLGELGRLRLAGDHYLWTRFATESEPTIVAAVLGGFRVHAGQLSEASGAYRQEAGSISDRTGFGIHAVSLFDAVVWRTPDRVKKAWNRRHLLRYDHASGAWV